MNNSDAVFEILVRILSDTVGEENARKALASLRRETAASATGYAGLTDATKQYIKSLEHEGRMEGGITAKRRMLDEMMRAMGGSIRQLAPMSYLVFNPMTVAVLGLIGAFEIWKHRVDDAADALGGLELPDLSQQPPQINQVAEAWKNVHDAVNKVVEAFNSVDSETDREIKKIDQQLDREKKLLASKKALAEADLEANKANLSPEQYAAAKAALDSIYGGESAEQERRANRARLMLQANKPLLLRREAEREMEDAARIRISPSDQWTEGELKKQNDVAEQQIKESREWIEKLAASKDSTGAAIEAVPGFFFRYGLGKTGTEAMAIERARIESAQKIQERYRAFLERAPDRERARKLKQEKEQDAARKFAEAAKDQLELPAQEKSEAQNEAATGEAQRISNLANLLKTSGQTPQQIFSRGLDATSALLSGKKLDASQQGATEMLGQLLEAMNWRMVNLVDVMEHQGRYMKALDARIAALK